MSRRDVERLEKLTDAQIALLPAIRDEWLAHGLSCEPADRPAAEAGVRLAYETAGLSPPSLVVWVDSPYAGCVGAAMLNQIWDQIGNQIGNQIWDQIWSQVRNQVRDQVQDQISDQILDQIGNQVRDQVRDLIWDQILDQVRNQVRDQILDQVQDQIWASLWGQHDAGWLAWTDTFTRFGLTAANHAEGLRTVARSAGWWWPYEHAVILADRPAHLHRDTQDRLHHETGPALAYRDGWSVYAWHGVRVPADLIEHGWDSSRILQEENQEIRRAAIERTGWDRFVIDAGLALVDEAADPANPGRNLYLYDIPEQIYGEAVRVLLCTNGTPERDGTTRRFGLTVPADINDAVHAAAWTYNVDRDLYAGLARRT